MNRIFLAAATALTLSATCVMASQSGDKIQGILSGQLAGWVKSPVVIKAIRTQNQDHAQISQADIDALDAKWRSEIGAAETPMQTKVLKNAVSQHLKRKQDAANGLVSEVFVMDTHGLNVGQSAVTSDYWQGDEAKFQDSFGEGAGGVHIGEVELDESTGDYVVQVSMTISDPDTGTPIGAVTYAINMGVLE